MESSLLLMKDNTNPQLEQRAGGQRKSAGDSIATLAVELCQRQSAKGKSSRYLQHTRQLH